MSDAPNYAPPIDYLKLDLMYPNQAITDYLYIFDCTAKKLYTLPQSKPRINLGEIRISDPRNVTNVYAQALILSPTTKDTSVRVKLRIQGISETDGIEPFLMVWVEGEDTKLIPLTDQWFYPQCYESKSSVVVCRLLMRVHPTAYTGLRQFDLQYDVSRVMPKDPEYAEPDIVDILTPEEYEYHCYDYMELNGFR